MLQTQPWRQPGIHELMALTLYEHPFDHPNLYEMRAWYILGDTVEPASSVLLFQTIDEAEALVKSASLDTAWRGRNTFPEIVRCWVVHRWQVNHDR